MTTRQPSKSREAVEDARAQLRAILPPGSTVYTVLRHVSASGMSRDIACYAAPGDGERDPRWITWWVATACGFRWNDDREAVRIGGAGMDMGFAIVYDLAHVLYPDGFECAGERCPSNDHSNGDRDHTPHHHGNGGYALRHRWL